MNTVARPVERNSPVSAWGQIARQLRAQIEAGVLAPGAQLPTEHELAEQFGVSRITIRQALASLAREELIERRQGSGTYVSPGFEPVSHDLLLATPWRDRFVAAGHSVESVLISTRETGFPSDLLKMLAISGIEPGDPAVMFTRAHRVDGRAIGITESWIPAETGRDLLLEPLVAGSLSQTLKERHGIETATVENYLSSSAADATQARILGTDPDAPLLVVVAAGWTSTGALVDVSRSSWLGSRVRFHFRRD